MSEVALLCHSVAFNALAVFRTLASHPLEHLRIGKVPDKLVDPGSPIEVVIVRAVENCRVPGFAEEKLDSVAIIAKGGRYGTEVTCPVCRTSSYVRAPNKSSFLGQVGHWIVSGTGGR